MKKIKYKFGFVVLHYKNIEDTIECIDSLESQKNIEALIFIVDNFSNDGTKEQLENKYGEKENIFLISSKANLGFAKGNNLGISLARKKGCDFVCLINNDTLIKQEEFSDKCIEEWEKYNYSIGGPRIISTIDGLDQNPYMLNSHFVKSKKDAIRMYFVALVKYIFIKVGFNEWWNKKNIRGSITENLEKVVLDSYKKDFLLNGACLILSPTFFKKYNKLCDWTFMYEEETIIYFLSRRLGIKNMYFPNIEIYHKEQSSTKKSFGTEKKKLLFGYKEDLNSRKQLLKIVFRINDIEFLDSLMK